jgi:hypothetical protein
MGQPILAEPSIDEYERAIGIPVRGHGRGDQAKAAGIRSRPVHDFFVRNLRREPTPDWNALP